MSDKLRASSGGMINRSSFNILNVMRIAHCRPFPLPHLAKWYDFNNVVVLELSNIGFVISGDELAGILCFCGNMAGQEINETNCLLLFLEIKIHAVFESLTARSTKGWALHESVF